ncbi:hypothetical protein AB0C18_41765 [Nonomuraea muscovyensis]|uniref:hypothetical protein n=1 Tax=Nonomuraea muscovyensis TaxID=1124761 RepID=UPI0033C48495
MQDALLHGQAADRQRIKVPEPWPTKIVTNLCLDRLRSAQAHPRTHRRSPAARTTPRRRPDAQPRTIAADHAPARADAVPPAGRAAGPAGAAGTADWHVRCEAVDRCRAVAHVFAIFSTW